MSAMDLISEILGSVSKLEGSKVKLEDLTNEERESLSQYATLLEKKTLTIEDVATFLRTRAKQIESELLDYDNSRDKDLFLKAEMRNIRVLQVVITSPEKSRQHAIQALEQSHGIKLK